MNVQLKVNSGQVQYGDALRSSAQKPIRVSKELAAFVNEFCATQFDDSVYTQSRIKFLMSGLVTALFDCIDPQGVRQRQANCEGRDENLPLIIEYLLNDTDMDLGGIADAIGYSVRHTSRLIRKLFHMSLSEIRKYRALQIAERLLKAGKVSEDEIAKLSGFETVDILYKENQKHEQL